MEGKGEENGNKGRREGKGLCMSLVSMGGISLIRVLSMIILKKKKKQVLTTEWLPWLHTSWRESLL